MTELAAITAHWNQQAAKGATAGTPDLILKQLEQRAILQAIGETPVYSALEIGCGLGETARLVVDQYPTIDLLALDNADAMITEARKAPYPTSRLRFRVGDVLNLPDGRFDLIYTQRCLINLPSWSLQRQAIQEIARRLAPGGRYLMVEHSLNGLTAINVKRSALGLACIQSPWHNKYFLDSELAEIECLRLVRCEPFSATYYFLSRIVNACEAKRNGHDPEYDAPINQLALKLPAGTDPTYAQGRLWIWERL